MLRTMGFNISKGLLSKTYDMKNVYGIDLQGPKGRENNSPNDGRHGIEETGFSPHKSCPRWSYSKYVFYYIVVGYIVQIYIVFQCFT